MTHDWPGSIFELLVLRSLPGYGFSGKPQHTGWGPDVAQGGD
jgi:hypothetical protein